MVVDTVTYLNKEISSRSKNILVEGANALMLDIDFGKFSHSNGIRVVIVPICGLMTGTMKRIVFHMGQLV